MNAILSELIVAHDVAKDAVESADKALSDYLMPIVEALGINTRRVFFIGVDFDRNRIGVEYGWSSRGYAGNDTIWFPAGLLDAEDRVEAALAHKVGLDRLAAAKDRAEKRSEIKRLQAELKETE